ncbi:glutamine synthetase, partial [Wolbachia endosymbiont of Atemnus politus]|nr:glutamine synthetase [Wolbachia endosymbiont of Atemnus politus]
MIMLSNLNCYAKFGIELEFYIERIEEEYLFLSSVKDKIASLGFSCEKESSIYQYEIKSGCYTDFNDLIRHLELAKELLTETAQKLGGSIS